MSSSPPFQVVQAGLTAAVLLLVADLCRGSALWSCCSDAVEGTAEEKVAEGGRPWLVSRRLDNNQNRGGLFGLWLREERDGGLCKG